MTENREAQVYRALRDPVDTNTALAREKLTKLYGPGLEFRFGNIRTDGTRNVRFRPKGSHQWSSYSYLTDIRLD